MDSGVPRLRAEHSEEENAAKRQRSMDLVDLGSLCEYTKEEIAAFSSVGEKHAAQSIVDEDSATIFYGFEADGSLCLTQPTSRAESVAKHPHYSMHTRGGGQIMNPESINDDQLTAGLIHVYEPYFDSEEFFEDEGPPSFAFLHGDGVLLAVNHPRAGSKPGSGSGFQSTETELPKNVTALNSHTMATISGKVADSELLLKRLKEECLTHEKEKEKRISVAEASQLMANILSYCFEVTGLIAGWDDETGAELYRVDGMGVVIKGKRFASGSGFEHTYFNMGLRGGWCKWDLETAAKAIILVAHRTRKGQVVNTVHPPPGVHGENFVSVYLVGPQGWQMPLGGEMDVSECLPGCGFRRGGCNVLVF